MENKKDNALTKPAGNLNFQRRTKIYRKLTITPFWRIFILILIFASIIRIPIEAAYLKDPEYVLIDSEHNIDQNGNCVVHAIVRNVTFERQILNAVSGITARHQVQYNDLRKYRTIIYMYRNIFDYVGEKPFKIYFQYSDSKFIHKPLR